MKLTERDIEIMKFINEFGFCESLPYFLWPAWHTLSSRQGAAYDFASCEPTTNCVKTHVI